MIIGCSFLGRIYVPFSFKLARHARFVRLQRRAGRGQEKEPGSLIEQV